MNDKKIVEGTPTGGLSLIEQTVSSRRAVLKWSGAGLIAAFALGSRLPGFGISDVFAASGVDLGKGDIGILNYAYALEQLEAAFYTQAVAHAYDGIDDAEKQVLTDIRDHEVTHRDFLKGALADKAIPDLEVDFGKVNFGDRASVLGTAKVFEDLGVSAYNGAGQYIENVDYLVAAGRIVSVEARHAATIRDLLKPKSVSFAGGDVVQNGLDGARKPSQVLKAAGPFVKTPFTAKYLK